MARERHVFPTDQVAHVWAQLGFENGGVDNGRNPGGNLYFKGDTIYSYGSHFPIAQIVRHPRDGRRAVYFTTRSYSVTTAKHLGIVRRALHSTDQVFNLDPGFWGQSDAAFQDYHERINALVLKASRVRSNQQYLVEQAQDLVAEANGYAVFLGRARRFVYQFTPEFLKGAGDRARAEAAKKAASEKRKAAQEAKLAARAVDMWVAGASVAEIREAVGSLALRYNGPVRMRVEGEEIVTTKSARVPVSHAARVWKFVKGVRAAGVEYKRNGHTEHVGHFAIDHIAADGTLTAGCHVIEYTELARVAALLNLEG